jgi:hypothetical protein
LSKDLGEGKGNVYARRSQGANTFGGKRIPNFMLGKLFSQIRNGSDIISLIIL